MVQVKIEITYNVDCKRAQMVPGAFEGSLTLNTAFGERVPLYKFTGAGDVDQAQAIAMAWVNGNLLEFDNPSCRPIKYLKVAEQ